MCAASLSDFIVHASIAALKKARGDGWLTIRPCPASRVCAAPPWSSASVLKEFLESLLGLDQVVDPEFEIKQHLLVDILGR